MVGKFAGILKRFSQIDLVKVFSLTAISTIVRMFTALISIKIIASLLGPDGIALIGQLNNFTTIIMAIASAGINQGVTKYVSEFKSSDSEINKFISTAFKMTTYASLAVGLVLIAGHQFFSNYILLTDEYGYVFVVFGLVILFYALNNLLMSIVNGYQEYKLFVNISIISSLFGLVFTILLVYFWGLKGVLLGLITNQSLMFFVAAWILRKKYWINFLSIKKKLDTPVAKKYLHYTLMTLTSLVTIPVSQLVIRSHVISHISISQAGYWEAMNRISGMYLMIITTSFSVYFLPRLAELKNNVELRTEIYKVYKMLIPFLIIVLTFIYFFRDFIVKIIFTNDFIYIKDMFIWQLIGDFFKMTSYILAFNMLAKSMTKIFIITEILSAVIYVVLAFIFVKTNGVIGITQAYMINYVAYLLIMIVVFRHLVFSSVKNNNQN